MTDRPDYKPHRPAAPTAAGTSSSSSSHATPSSSKRPRWTTSTFGPSPLSVADKGEGREGAHHDRGVVSRVAPPSFAFAGKAASASKPSPKPRAPARQQTAGLPELPLNLPEDVVEDEADLPSKRPRLSTGSILGRLPIPLAAAAAAQDDSPASSSSRTRTTPALKRTRPLMLATSLSGGGPVGSSGGAKAGSLRRTMALSSVVPPAAAAATPSKTKPVKAERELMLGLLDIPQGKPRIKEEGEASTSTMGESAAAEGASAAAGGEEVEPGGVKLEDALLGVSPHKGRKTSGLKGNLQTAASLLLTSHHAAQTRFYRSLLARRDALPQADVELRIVSIPSADSAQLTTTMTTAQVPARRLFAFQKTGPPVKRIALVCEHARQAVKKEPEVTILVPASSGSSPSPSPSYPSANASEPTFSAAAKVHVLLRLDEHSTSLPPAVSRWPKPRVGQRVLGWRPWVELGVTGESEERVLGLERFVVLNE